MTDADIKRLIAYYFAFTAQLDAEVGRLLAENDCILVCGGLGGVMAAAARGARDSGQFSADRVLAILPTPDLSDANEYTGIKILTDMGYARNRLIIINSDAIIAIGGGAGTLNEITLAWEMNKPLACFVGGGGWSEKMAGVQIDRRREGVIHPVHSVDDAISWLNSLIK